MARCIDADKVMEEIASMGGHNLCEWSTLGVKALIERQPTVDVALRADVAREIFEEIEILLSANASGEFRGDSIEWFDYFDLHLAEDIAELKKKYMEEKK